eukprot:4858461-Prymnesium_polylepis.1
MLETGEAERMHAYSWTRVLPMVHGALPPAPEVQAALRLEPHGSDGMNCRLRCLPAAGLCSAFCALR